VRGFYARALLTAARLRDWRTVHSSAPPRDVAALLELFAGRRRVVEIGTAGAWTAIALTLADPERRVRSLDPTVRPWRERYVALMPEAARRRLSLEQASGADAPGHAEPVDALFVDADKRAEGVLAIFGAWEPLVEPGGIVVFHDYGHPEFPGIAAAVRELGLAGETRGPLFAWRKPLG
jgi:predicted O-methyltransferase YrrM